MSGRAWTALLGESVDFARVPEGAIRDLLLQVEGLMDNAVALLPRSGWTGPPVSAYVTPGNNTLGAACWDPERGYFCSVDALAPVQLLAVLSRLHLNIKTLPRQHPLIWLDQRFASSIPPYRVLLPGTGIEDAATDLAARLDPPAYLTDACKRAVHFVALHEVGHVYHKHPERAGVVADGRADDDARQWPDRRHMEIEADFFAASIFCYFAVRPSGDMDADAIASTVYGACSVFFVQEWLDRGSDKSTHPSGFARALCFAGTLRQMAAWGLSPHVATGIENCVDDAFDRVQRDWAVAGWAVVPDPSAAGELRALLSRASPLGPFDGAS